MRSLLLIVTALAAVSSALPVVDVPHVRHEKRDVTHKTWFKRRAVPASHKLPVRIGMTQSNLDKGHDLLMEVSSPTSHRYGQHYTADEVADLFAPSRETVDKVSEWLRSAGVSNFSQSINKQWMQVDLKAEELGSLLRTKYHEYVHTTSGAVHVACDEYHIPEHLADHVDYVTPGIKLFAGARTRGKSSSKKRDFSLPPLVKPIPPSAVIDAAPQISPTSVTQCDRLVQPQCIRALYNVTLANTSYPGNELGIFEDLGEYYDQADLNLLYKTVAPNIPKGYKPVGKPIDGAPLTTDQVSSGAESLLDLTIAIPLLYPQKTWLYNTDDALYEADYEYDGFLNNFFDAIDGSYCTYSAFGETGNSPLDPPYPDNRTGGYNHSLQCGKYRPTNVISISYGGQEPDLPVSYQRRQCNEIMKLGMQGVTVVVSSGDSGVGVTRGNNTNTCLGPNGTIFNPDFPATCPYITTVGSTYLPRGANVRIDAERATDRFPSGGGFSNIYPMPDWQKSAVDYFLAYYNPYPTYNIKYQLQPSVKQAGPGIFNRGGRAYPDLGAAGDNIFFYWQGIPRLVGGTSASAPIVAGLLTRINEVRLYAGKSTVGFVNPVLYANPQAFHDIANGSNPNCASPGFQSVPGWDPVTGLGTPNYPALLSAFMALP